MNILWNNKRYITKYTTFCGKRRDWAAYQKNSEV